VLRLSLLDVFDAIKGRRSIREYYEDVDVPEDDLSKILEAAIQAPSAGNLQPWEFIVVKNPKTRELLAKAALGQYWMTTAPVHIVVCANETRSSRVYGLRGKTLYCIQDTAAAIQNMLLAAYALGYGTCWVGAFDEEAVRRILNIPSGVRPVAIVTLGKPAEQPYKTGRRPLKDVVHREAY